VGIRRSPGGVRVQHGAARCGQNCGHAVGGRRPYVMTNAAAHLTPRSAQPGCPAFNLGDDPASQCAAGACCGLRCRHRCRQFRSGTGLPLLLSSCLGPALPSSRLATDLSERLPPDLIRAVGTAAAHRSRKVLATTDLATGWWRFVRRSVLGGAHLRIISGLPTASAGAVGALQCRYASIQAQ
jgi:hypothetical protein